VLIIKLGALGDVARTSCLLPGLAARPEPPHVTWVTSPSALPLVQRMPGVDRALVFKPATFMQLENEQFDTVISLDKEPAPCALAMRVKAEERLGIGLSRYGTVYPMNEECGYYFRLGLDNDEKFHGNQKSYQRLIHEALGWDYQGQGYALELKQAERLEAERRLAEWGVPDGTPLIGLSPGTGTVYANKAWREAGYIELVARLGRRDRGPCFLLLGGPDEQELLDRIANGCSSEHLFKCPAGPPIELFAALIERCAVVISGDTLAMHLAVGLGRRSVAIFGPTCHQEIDLQGRGEKIVTPIECSPCYLRQCDKSPTCQDMVPAEVVEAAVTRQLAEAAKPGREPDPKHAIQT